MVIVSDGGGDAGRICGYGGDIGGSGNNSGGEWVVVVMLVVMMGLMVAMRRMVTEVVKVAVVMVTSECLSCP